MIRLIAAGVIGWFLTDAGVHANDYRFWVILLAAAVIQATSEFIGRRAISR